ncbi:MOSC N-terminal beta barrel domain-containing protein [Pelistega indica]|nr:MOSC N-terminal beta barrel domain-containing protein [Pelistega indica]
MYTPIMQCPAVQNKEVVEDYQNRWVLLDEDNKLLSKDHPKIVDMTLDIKFGYLVIRAPGMLRLDIPMDVLEDDESAIETIADERLGSKRVVSEGDLAAQWLSVYFGRPVRLMKIIV